jgi:hypothetical protein
MVALLISSETGYTSALKLAFVQMPDNRNAASLAGTEADDFLAEIREASTEDAKPAAARKRRAHAFPRQMRLGRRYSGK